MRLVAEQELKVRCSPVPYLLLWLLPRQGKSPISGGYQVGGRSPCLRLGVDTIAARGAAGGHEWTELWLLARALWWVPPPSPSLLFFSASPEHPLLEGKHAVSLIFLSSNPGSFLRTSSFSQAPLCSLKPPLAPRGTVPRSSPWGF